MRQLEEQKSPPVRGQMSCDVADNVSSTGKSFDEKSQVILEFFFLNSPLSC
jgi:hypothetical protein